MHDADTTDPMKIVQSLREAAKIPEGDSPLNVLLAKAKEAATERASLIAAAKDEDEALPRLPAIAHKKVGMTLAEAKRYVAALLSFAAKPGAAMKINSKTLAADVVDKFWYTSQKLSDADVATGVKKLDALADEDSRYQWILDHRRELSKL